MATVDDIGTPGNPLNSPPLTEWQAAVRDAINGDGVWKVWAPTVTGCTVQSLGAMYTRTGDTVIAVVKLIVATVTGDITVSAPAAADPTAVAAGVGSARMVAGAGAYHAHVYLSGSSTLAVRIAGTNGLSTAISPTVPATWVAGNTIGFVATYQAA